MQKQEINEQHFQIFLNQVSGHSILLKEDGTSHLLKPVKENEMKYFLFQNGSVVRQLENLRNIYPHFMLNHFTLDTQTRQQWMDQLIKKRFSSQKELYIQIEDLTAGLQYPCILDLKMGFSAYHEKDEVKYHNSTSQTVGFRVCGMNINQPNEHTVFKDKYWGRQLTDKKLTYSLAAFFFDKSTHTINTKLITHFIEELEGLNQSIILNKQFRWISSSLLLIYNGNQQEQNTLKLIDFANCQSIKDAEEPDEPMIEAIQNLINTLNRVLEIQEFTLEEAIK